jgi:hypothetical protein
MTLLFLCFRHWQKQIKQIKIDLVVVVAILTFIFKGLIKLSISLKFVEVFYLGKEFVSNFI